MKNEIKEAAVVTKDTVNAENAVAKFEVGKVYWASAGHRVIAVKRTAHYVTFNLLKVELEAGQNYFDAEAMTWLKASNVRVKVTKTGNGETCYIKGYEENRAIEINADMPIEIVSDEENEVLAADYNFEEDEADDELIDPAEVSTGITEEENAAKEEEKKEYAYGNLNIEITDKLIRVDMFDKSKKLDTSVRHFVKMYNQAYKDGVVEFDMFGGDDNWTAEEMNCGVERNASGKVAFVFEYEEGEFENYIFMNINRYNMAHYFEVNEVEKIYEDDYEVYGEEDKDVCDMESKLEDAIYEEVDFIDMKVKRVLSGNSVFSKEVIEIETAAATIEGEMNSTIEDEALATVGETWDYAEIGTPEMTPEEKDRVIEIAEEVMLEAVEERKAKNKAVLLAEIEKVQSMFEIARFGEDNAIAQKFSAVVDLAIEEFASKVKGIIAAIKVEEFDFDTQRFNGEDTTVEEVATPAKFEVGKIYYGKISPSRVYVEVKVVKRTAKFVTVVDYSEDYEYIDYDEAERHRIQIDNKGELIEFNDDFGVPYYVRANHSEPPKKYKDKCGQEGYYFEDDAWIPEEVTAAEDTAEKEIPVVDEETKLRGEYAELSSEIDTLEKKLQELQGRRLDVGTKLSDVVRSKIEETFQKAKEAIKKAAKVGASIELRVANREGYYWIEGGEEWEDLLCSVSYNGDVMVEIGDKEVVRYKDKWEGTAAIEGLIAAIERGDEIYTFPVDGAKKAQKK